MKKTRRKNRSSQPPSAPRPSTATGDLDFILDQLPIQGGGDGPCCHFLFEDGNALALFSMEMGAGFFAAHQDEGCSVRGSKPEVMAEVGVQFQEQTHCWGLVMQT